MKNQSLDSAAKFIATYGNVTSDPDDLIGVEVPTESQLRMAAERCHAEVDAAFQTIRKFHNLPDQVGNY